MGFPLDDSNQLEFIGQPIFILKLMINYTLIAILLVLLGSCSNSENQHSNMKAQATADITRAHWEEARKPFVISIENGKSQELISEIGVYVELNDATDEERNALSGVSFSRTQNVYKSSDRTALTTDTLAAIHACYPYRKGVKANDIVAMKAPFDDNLYCLETSRSHGSYTQIQMKMQSSMAKLRIRVESNEVRDILNSLQIIGDVVYKNGTYKPYSGQWVSKLMNGGIVAKDHNILLNNGRNHDFYLIPTDDKGVVTFFAKINERNYAVKTTLPPLAAGSQTQIIMKKGKDGITICNSWVESERPLMEPKYATAIDTVNVGYYLQKEGFISQKMDSNSIALIVETDGKHGKAISLNDEIGYFCFSKKPLTSGKLFLTVDGKRKEGILNPSKEDGIEEENTIIFKPKMPYTEKCALGYFQGEMLTHKLLTSTTSLTDLPSTTHASITVPRKSMLEAALKQPGSYVPSLAEMAKLYYSLHPFKGNPLAVKGFKSPSGEYITSTEQSDKSFYMIDFERGIITGGLSKQYSKLQLRLFYLF